MRFILAQIITFVLGVFVAIWLIKKLNPQLQTSLEKETKPHRQMPKHRGPPPKHDLQKKFQPQHQR